MLAEYITDVFATQEGKYAIAAGIGFMVGASSKIGHSLLNRYKRKFEHLEHMADLGVEGTKAENRVEFEKVQNEEKERARLYKANQRICAAERLVELKPVLEEYLASLTGEDNMTDFINERQDFREYLVNDFLKSYSQDYIEAEIDIDEEDETNIERLIDVKYPLDKQVNGMPPELKNLIEIVRDGIV